jgi:hypothetical protein
VRKADQIKELESLIMRIADPTGNATRGRLPRAENLRKQLHSNIRREQDRQLSSLIGPKRGLKQKVSRSKTTQLGKRSRQPALAPYISTGFKIRATRKDKVYKASVRSNGRIYFRGKLYNSPSTASKVALGYTVNGWKFWHFERTNDEWVLLKELKEKQQV